MSASEYDESESDSDSSSSVNMPAYTGLLLDFDSQAECTGTGVVWHYCFYLESSSSYYSQVAEFGVYRMQESGKYVRVEESRRRVEIRNEYSLLVPDFICQNITLDNPFSILKGDLIGACLLNDPTNYRYALDLLAIVNDSHRLRYKTNSNMCISSESSEVDPFSVEWSSVSGTALHLYLEINQSEVTTTPTLFHTDRTDKPLTVIPTSTLSISRPRSTIPNMQLNSPFPMKEENVESSSGSRLLLSQKAIAGITAGLGALISILLCFIAALVHCIVLKRRKPIIESEINCELIKASAEARVEQLEVGC